MATETAAGGRLQTFMESARCYAGLPRHAHKPDFRVMRVRETPYRGKFFWIEDGGQRIGLLNLSFGEIEMFRFFPPAGGRRVEYRMPALYDWRTLRGARICIVPQSTWSDRGKMEILQGRGETLRMRYSESFGGRTCMVHSFALRFDSVLGYVLDCAFEMQMGKPRRFEYANILAGGLMESRDDRKRFQKCIWTRRDGTICYQYQNPLSRMQLAGSAWADMPDGGFVGWVAERHMNPFLEILQASPTTFRTCPMWYDQHVFGLPPTEKGEDGLCHISATYRLLSLPLPLAKELEDAARVMLPAKSAAESRGSPLGFLQGVVNDFETPIPTGTLYNGCQWTREAEWDTEVGRSGAKSLRVRGRKVAQPIHAGTAIFLESGRRYRFAAWVRTRGVTGGAYLRLSEVFWSWRDVRASHRTKSLKGNKEWTRLEVEFEPVDHDPFALPSLIVEGKGTAWFDDVELVEVNASR